ncbi:unnamed protein product [Adineta steineri]|uniref:Cystatin domain-containing protein n=1 Tax=Adineta steineri TaxID=433720 RepID=A0A814YS72_9BILA|nr:unnamed protein product [Adineta steineri]CAF1179922.1 unnamed protein product [Adineta steineri]CAF1234916.1 unnamed protein product [Adineta steineri]
MSSRIFLILFCIIIIFFIEFNNGAPTVKTTAKTTTKTPKTTIKVQKNSTEIAKPALLGGHTPWTKTIQPKHKKIFDDYKKIILKKLQEVHNVSKTFNPKPEKFSVQVVGGFNYLYLVKLPINKYASVSIHHVAWKKGHYGKETNVIVPPKTYELDDKNV